MSTRGPSAGGYTHPPAVTTEECRGDVAPARDPAPDAGDRPTPAREPDARLYCTLRLIRKLGFAGPLPTTTEAADDLARELQREPAWPRASRRRLEVG